MGRSVHTCHYILAFFLIVILCTGCVGQAEDDNDFLVVEKEKEQIQYVVAAVSVSDVIRTEQIPCTYLQVNDQDISFSVSGKRISHIYADVGDGVVRGQLLAELANDQTEKKIAELEYRIGRNRMLLEDSKLNEDYEISARWLQFLYHSGNSKEEEEALKESIRQLQKNYQLLREDYQDAIDLDNLELKKLREDAAVSRVYAEMNGVVSWVRSNLEGSTSIRGEVIMKVIDNSECLFIVEGTEYAHLFEEDVPVEMSITFGRGAGQYEILPYRKDEWADRLTFSLPGEYDSSVIDVGTSGTIRVAVDKSTQVLAIPSQAVHLAEDATYVYVVGEDNMREIRWIEVGLYGDENVEVTAGLEKGELVIVK